MQNASSFTDIAYDMEYVAFHKSSVRNQLVGFLAFMTNKTQSRVCVCSLYGMQNENLHITLMYVLTHRSAILAHSRVSSSSCHHSTRRLQLQTIVEVACIRRALRSARPWRGLRTCSMLRSEISPCFLQS